jgi:hypothetical protein
MGLEDKDINYMDDNELLKTIRLPKNLIGLSDKLPKANYLPNLNINNNNPNNNNKNNTTNSFSKSNTFQNKNFPNIKTKTNNIRLINNTNSFNKNSNYNSKKFITNKDKIKKGVEHTMTQKLYRLYATPGKTQTKKPKFDKSKEFTINSNGNKRKFIKNKRIIETYRLYVSNDSKKILGSKKNFLPKLRTNVKGLKK